MTTMMMNMTRICASIALMTLTVCFVRLAAYCVTLTDGVAIL